MTSEDPKLTVRKAQEAENRGEEREASALFALAALGMGRASQFTDARELIVKAISLSPQSARLYVQLAIFESTLGHEEEASRAIEKFAEVARNRGKLVEYRPYFEKHLAVFPRLRQVLYRSLLSLDRTDASPFIDYAQAAIDQGDWEGAKENLLDALKTKTSEQQALEKLQAVFLAMGESENVDLALLYAEGKLTQGEFFRRLAMPVGKEKTSRDERPPVSPEDETLGVLVKRLEKELGLSLQEKHDTVRPLINEFRRRSDAVIGEDSRTRIDLAVSFYEMGFSQDAREELEKISMADPKYLEAQVLIGEILFAEGSFLAALDVYQSCLRNDQATEDILKEARYRLVLTYERLGDLDSALKAAHSLEEESPSYRDIRHLRRLLTERTNRKG